MRLFTGAVSSCFDLMAIAAGVRADAEFLEHPSVQLLETMANHHICWVNDILGVRREILEGNVNNLVLVLRDELDVPLQAAIDRAVALCDAELRAFLRLEARRPSFGAEERQARRYIAGLLSWMSGHIEWYSVTGRYHTAAA
jgi:5-epi-alpha-selinene synthase